SSALTALRTWGRSSVTSAIWSGRSSSRTGEALFVIASSILSGPMAPFEQAVIRLAQGTGKADRRALRVRQSCEAGAIVGAHASERALAARQTQHGHAAQHRARPIVENGEGFDRRGSL